MAKAESVRVVCVSISLVLTLGALVAMLGATAAGVALQDTYPFQFRATGNYFFSPSSRTDPAGFCKLNPTGLNTNGLFNGIGNTCSRRNKRTIRFNAADIGVRAEYNVSLWGYCQTPQNASRVCSEPRINWAEPSLNAAKRTVEDWINAKDRHKALPERFANTIQTFSFWTLVAEVLSVISVMALSTELLLGIFVTRRLVVSCATFLVACVATVASALRHSLRHACFTRNPPLSSLEFFVYAVITSCSVEESRLTRRSVGLGR
ncbi:hypothetical protein BJX96DRAFT_45371 [Aspergillus floccosus]